MTKHSPRRHADILAACGLLLLVVAFWSPWLFGGNVPVPGDQQTWMLPWAGSEAPIKDAAQWQAWWWDGVAQFYPWRVQLNRWLSRGEWPLWSTQQFCGYPFVGNGQSAMFYPPNWLYGLVHPRVGYGLVAALHFALAALLTFAFCRTVGLCVSAAFFGAIGFAFGGPMVGLEPLATMINSAAWLPGCLLGVELLMRRRSVPGACVLAFCAGMTILAGHVQTGAYALLATGIYAVARIAYALWRKQRFSVGWLVAAGAIAAGLAAAQALPTLELGGMSPRGGAVADEAGFQAASNWAMKPIELLTLALPEFLGHPARGDYPLFNYGERTGYLGIITLIMALIGLVLSRRGWKWAVAAGVVVTLWAVMGGLPARLIYFGVPRIGMAGGFLRLLFIYTFLLSVSAAIGLDALVSGAASKRPNLHPLTRAAAPVAVAMLCVELFTWGWRTVPTVPASRLYASTELTDHLQANCGPGDRILAITRRDQWTILQRPNALMPPNSATVFDGLESVQGYDSLFPANVARFAGWFEEGELPAPAANGNMMLLENTSSPLLDVAGVRWVLTPAGPADESASGDGRVLSGVLIERNDDALPRAFATSAALGAGGWKALRQLASAEYVPLQIADTGSCNKLMVDLPSSDGAAVITNTYYPGWRAWLGPREVRIDPAGGVFQSLESQPGGGRAMLAFVPASVAVGLYLFLSALGTLGGLMVFHLYVRARGAGA